MASSMTVSLADTSIMTNPQIKTDLLAAGWQEIEMKRQTHRGKNDNPFVDEDFVVFHRSKNYGNNAKNTQKILSPKGVSGTNDQNGISGVDPLSIGVSNDLDVVGSTATMGVPIVTTDPTTIFDGVDPGENQGQGSHNLVAQSVNQIVSIADIPSIKNMRLEKDSFVIGFDTEFYYDESVTPAQRYILSWQFAFIDPSLPDDVQEILVFAKTERCLPFSLILNFIIAQFQLFPKFTDHKSVDGFTFYSTRRWIVPAKNKRGAIKPKAFTKFEDALTACVEPKLITALNNVGKWHKAETDVVDTIDGRQEVVLRDCFMYGDTPYPIGYMNQYTEADKHSIPVTLVCHTASADITTFDFSSTYEKDMLTNLSQVQGGLVTLKPYMMHNPTLQKYNHFYPVQITVKDTMCFAPAGMKKLENLGEVIGIPKLELPAPYTKDDMYKFCNDLPVEFAEYGINDSVIALIYSAELWGVNKEMPVTVSSAAGRASVGVIQQYFGIDEKDREAFNQKFRGLKTVKHGLVARTDKPGYLQQTSLEPLDANCDLLQRYAQQSYKGGFNGSCRIGYFPEMTYDFDLENAYPTCMSLVPDVDWSDCIGYELTGKQLTLQDIRTPFEPIFAYCEFEFPDDVKFPCCPITVDGSLIYPRTSKGMPGVYLSCPELYLAVRLGCKITAKRLIVGKVLIENGQVSHSLFSVVKQFVNDRDLAKKVFGKGSLADLLLKTGVNSIYGKTAQDVIDKTTWSAKTEEMVDLGGSPITSPVHAALTTAGVRCVLIAAMNEIESLNYKVYSVTTDGFISDIPYDLLVNLDLYGFTKGFQASRNALVGDPTMWATKHCQNDLVNLTTRGNASLNVGDKDAGILPGVMAHNSMVTGKESDSYEDRYAFVTAVLDRDGRVRSVNKSFAKFKHMSRRENRIDFYVTDQERNLTMDFDLKRKPIRDSFYTAYPVIDGKKYEIACFDTEPYESIDEFQTYKQVGRNSKVLRTEKDWSLFFDKIDGKKTGHHRNIQDLDWSILCSAIMAQLLEVPLDFNNGEPIKLPFLLTKYFSRQEACDIINQFNESDKVFKVENLKNLRRPERISQMLPEKAFQEKLEEMIEWWEDIGEVAYEYKFVEDE